jgi:hypothetical protein
MHFHLFAPGRGCRNSRTYRFSLRALKGKIGKIFNKYFKVKNINHTDDGISPTLSKHFRA